MTMVIKISENIALLRKKKGITQEELANKLKVSNQAVSKWEAGKCCPDIELLPALASFLGVSIDELLAGKNSIELQAMKIAQENRRISAPILQRRLNIGYIEAKKLIDDLHKDGYIVKNTTARGDIYLYNSKLAIDSLPIDSEQNKVL